MRCLLFVVCWLLVVGCCSLFDARCCHGLLFSVCLFAWCCLFCCLLFARLKERCVVLCVVVCCCWLLAVVVYGCCWCLLRAIDC